MAKQSSTSEPTPPAAEPSNKPTDMVLFARVPTVAGLPEQLQKALAPYKVREVTGVNPQWKPDKPGDTCAGILVRFKQEVPTQYGPGSVCTIQTKDGPRDVWLGADLKMKIDAQSVGRPVVIVYDGEIMTGKGKNAGKAMKSYRVLEILDIE